MRSQTSIPLGHDFHDDTHCDDLKEASDLVSPLAVVPSIEFSTVSDIPEGGLTIHDSSLPFALLEELEERDTLEIDASSDD